MGMGTMPARISPFPKNGSEFDRIEQQKDNAAFLPQPERSHHIGKSIARDLQIAVAQFTDRIDKRALGTKTARNSRSR